MSRRAAWSLGMATLAVLMVQPGCRSLSITSLQQVKWDWKGWGGAGGEEKFQVKFSPSKNKHYREIVERVGRRLAAMDEASGHDWEFRVVDSEQSIAWCLPGGKVVVHEKILPFCRNEAGLAALLAHEMAHEIAGHDGSGTGDQENAPDPDHLLARYGLLVGYNRAQEDEADEIGLALMARAGYDPAEAIELFRRLAFAARMPMVPEFTVIHGADSRQLTELRKHLPAATAIYKKTLPQYGQGEILKVDD